MPSTVGIVASGEDVLNDAVFWVDAGRSSVVSGALSNLGTGGSTLNAVFGNSTGVDSFDPALLTHTGTNHLHLPGVAGNYASTPDSVALDIIGDIEIVARVSMDDWTPSANSCVVSKRGAAGQYSWTLLILTTGQLQLVTTVDGTTQVASNSVIPPSPFTNGVTYWLKITRASATGTCTWSWAPDQTAEPLSWTSISPNTTGAANPIYASTAQVEIGASTAGGTSWNGNFYRVIIRNGIGGTTVFDADFTTGITSGGQTTFTESSANAATVTINRSTSGRKAVAVTRPILLFGTDDYLEVADNDLLDFGAGEPFTVFAALRQWNTPLSGGRIVSKAGSGTITGWHYANTGTTFTPLATIGDGVTTRGVSPTTLVNGTLACTGFTVNRSTQFLTAFNGNNFSGNQSISTVGSLANANPMRIGSIGAFQGSYAEMELVAAAVWRRALNANEIATIVARYT